MEARKQSARAGAFNRMKADLRGPRFPYWLGVALLAVLAAGWAPAGRAASGAKEDCLRCHGEMEALQRRATKPDVSPLLVPPEEFARSEHRRLKCTRCHSKKHRTFPHPPTPKPSDCETCHIAEGTDEIGQAAARFSQIAAEFRQSVHLQRHPKVFTCHRCHDPHRFRLWREVSRPMIAEQNRVCLACHASDSQFAQIAPQRPRPDPAKAHVWLPHWALHQRQVRCLDCHAVANPNGYLHQIVSKEEALRDCVACHSHNSLLKTTLYRRVPQEEGSSFGFTNAALLKDAYVMAATRHRLLDWAGSVAVLLSLFGVAAHGLLRWRAMRRRAQGVRQ